jgi:PAS domain S-box-containing protein
MASEVEQHDTATRLAAQHAIARELLRADTLEEAAPGVIAAAASALGGMAGALWQVPEKGDALELVGTWDATQGLAFAMWRSSDQIRFEPGVGLPGRTWASGELTWISELSSDPNFPRTPAAAEAGLTAGLAVPAPVGDPRGVLAVMEFFTDSFTEPDAELTELLTAFGDQVAQFVRRRRGEQAQRRLAAIVESTHDAVLSKDPNGIVTGWNPAAERLYGYREDDALGRHISFLIPPDRRGEERRILDRVIRGERLDSYETVRMRADGTLIDVSLTVSPIVDAQGGITGASVIARDITDRRRAAKAQEFLAAASATFDSSLHPGATLRTIIRTAVPELAEMCLVDLVQDDGSIGGTVVAATDPALARELEDLRRCYPLDRRGSHPVAEVLRTRRSMVIRDLTTPEATEAVAQSDEHREFMRRAGYNSAAVVPMSARGRLLGAISFLHVEGNAYYEPADLALLADLGARAAIAYDNARLYAERTRIARTLQQSLLPPELPAIPGFSVAASFLPAGEGNDVGGDFYDVFEADGGWMVIVGDVCGKGADAAALTAVIRNSVRALALKDDDPASILDGVNRVMLHHDLGLRFATAVLGRLVPSGEGAHMRLAVAGHPPPLILRADETVRSVGGRGHVLGIGPDASYECRELELAPGDTLVLYTDGVLDAAAPKGFMTLEQLESLLAQASGLPTHEVVHLIERQAMRLSHGAPRDDVAILAVTARR